MLLALVIRQYEPKDQESVQCIFQDGMQAYIRQVQGNLRHFMQVNMGRALNKDLAQIDSAYGLRDGTGNFLVAEHSESGSILGMVGVQQISISSAEIRRMSVITSHQGQGLGTLLLDSAERWCLERSIEFLTLTTLSNMRQACRFYEARGFTEDYREPYPPKSKVPPEQSQMIHYKKVIKLNQEITAL